MKKLINLFFLLLALTTMSLISCSKNEIENDVFEFDIPEGNRELYDQITTELYDYLYSHEDATIEDIQEQLKKYPTQVTSEVHDDVLYLKIDSVYDFICDPYMKTSVKKDEGDYYVKDLTAEINSALYPEGGKLNISTKYINKTTKSNKNTRGIKEWWGELWNPNLLKKERILIWDPFMKSSVERLLRDHFSLRTDQSNGKKYLPINGKKIEVVTCYNYDADYSKINSFDDYDIVFMCSEGVELWSGNEITGYSFDVWDRSFFNKIFGCGPNACKTKTLTLGEIDKVLPKNLSHTILWTAICWADCDKSYLKECATKMERKCVAFAGVNTKCYLKVVQRPFIYFLQNFYFPSSIISAAESALSYDFIEDRNPEELQKIDPPNDRRIEGSTNIFYMNYHVNIDSNPTDGLLTFRCYNPEATTKDVHAAMDAISGLPRGSITMPYEKFVSAFASRKGTLATRVTSEDGYSMGFWVRNKETKEEIEIEFSDSTVVIYANDENPKYYPKDNNLRKEIVRVEIFGKTDDLAPGTYEYRTYLEIDGEKEYSDSIYEFTVMDIKHLSCPDYNHPHLIDLGLPSGTKWLCCNLGVENLVNTGHYFAWGVTLPYDKNDYQLMHYPRFYYPYSECHGGSDLDLAYQWDGDIYTDIGNNISGTAYDAAYSKSNLIRMPTKEDFEELIESCAFLMGPVCISDGTSSNLLYSGSVAIGPNGNMIALPIANYWTGTLSKEEESGGALLAYPRVNGVSGSAYSFVGEDVNYTSVSLDESVKLLLHYIKDDEVDRNIYYFIGSKFYMPSIAPKKRFHPYYIRPVGR